MAGKLSKLTQEQADEAVRLYGPLSLQKLADKYGVTRQSMWDLLRRRMKLRPQARVGSENHFHRGTEASDWAQNKVENAIKRGDLVRPDRCEMCDQPKIFKNGRSGIQAHHPDYNKPLEVMWLCQPCHHQWHKENTATPRHESARQ